MRYEVKIFDDEYDYCGMVEIIVSNKYTTDRFNTRAYEELHKAGVKGGVLFRFKDENGDRFIRTVAELRGLPATKLTVYDYQGRALETMYVPQVDDGEPMNERELTDLINSHACNAGWRYATATTGEDTIML